MMYIDASLKLAFWGVMWVPMVMLHALLKCFFHPLCSASCAIILAFRTSYSTVSYSSNLTPLGFCGFPNWGEEWANGVQKKSTGEEKKQNFQLSLKHSRETSRSL